MKKTYRTFIVVHFLIVILTVSHLYELVNWNPVKSLFEIYSSFTYTNRNFGFFAPTVNDDFSIDLIAFKNNQKIGQKILFNESNSENKIRLSTMLWHFAEGNSNSQMDLYARSWAIYCMNKDSLITSVKVSVYKNNIPTMKDFRLGKQISKTLYYQTTIYAN